MSIIKNNNKNILATITLVTSTLFPSLLRAHEAWLLTPDQMMDLAKTMPPDSFTNLWLLSSVLLLFTCLFMICALLEPRYLTPSIKQADLLHMLARGFGPTILRLGLGLMLIAASTGLSPMHGVSSMTKPTLLVPNMFLDFYNAQMVIVTQCICGFFLIFGLCMRLAAIIVFALVLFGFFQFGIGMMDYAFHFLTPAILLFLHGPGRWSFEERVLGKEAFRQRYETRLNIPEIIQKAAIFSVGATFSYLSVKYKFSNPLLVMTILKEGSFPSLGLDYDYIALIMASIEVIAGLVFAFGFLVRPIALLLIGAFTLFVFTLGETPLLHANLYALMAYFFLTGAKPLNTPTLCSNESNHKTIARKQSQHEMLAARMKKITTPREVDRFAY